MLDHKRDSSLLSDLRQSGQQEAEHGDEAYDHAAVLPHVVHTLLQQVQDPGRPVDAQRPVVHCGGGPVGGGGGGHTFHALPRETCSGHGETTPGLRPAAANAAWHCLKIVIEGVFTLAAGAEAS